ncbi:MAG: alpha/beta hydrolase [Gammaproteobacteria bacterium]|nr:MAG: alpha/beta hydrolase [Gammaproteobacteria bacterium]
MMATGWNRRAVLAIAGMASSLPVRAWPGQPGGGGMRSRYMNCAGREIHFTEWGSPAGEPVVVWHGLTQNCRAFDRLNAALAERYRVICPDTIGRGLSEWARDPVAEYTLENYGRLALTLLDQLGIDRLRWVGVSMGGMLGIALAGDELRGRISHLVLNDVGPVARINAPDNAGRASGVLQQKRQKPEFATMADFMQYLRAQYTLLSGVVLDEADWWTFAEISARRSDAGRITMHHDPQVLERFAETIEGLDYWPQYERIGARTLVLHGAESTVLPAALAQEMGRRGPRPRIVDFPGIGHAPFLWSAAEIELLRAFLDD